MSKSEDTASLERLLDRYHGRITRWIQRNAGPALLRFESVEDLLQTTYAQALAAASRFEHRTEAEFQAWLFTITRRCLRDRQRHWFALKRNSGKILRLTWSGAGSVSSAPPILETGAGPATLALRREQFLLVTRALDHLTPRDRDLVRWWTEGLSTAELAVRLDLRPRAAERARQRALERLRDLIRRAGRTI